MDRSGRLRNIPTPISMKEPTRTPSPSLTTVSSFFGDCGAREKLGGKMGLAWRRRCEGLGRGDGGGTLFAVVRRWSAIPVSGWNLVTLGGLGQPGHADDPVIGLLQVQDADTLGVSPDFAD